MRKGLRYQTNRLNKTNWPESPLMKLNRKTPPSPNQMKKMTGLFFHLFEKCSLTRFHQTPRLLSKSSLKTSPFLNQRVMHSAPETHVGFLLCFPHRSFPIGELWTQNLCGWVKKSTPAAVNLWLLGKVAKRGNRGRLYLAGLKGSSKGSVGSGDIWESQRNGTQIICLCFTETDEGFFPPFPNKYVWNSIKRKNSRKDSSWRCIKKIYI